jgi:hypothetical protein
VIAQTTQPGGGGKRSQRIEELELIAGLFTSPLAARSTEVPSPEFAAPCSRATYLRSLSRHERSQWIAQLLPSILIPLSSMVAVL